MNSHPLVSIVIATYNSEKYIIETLDSVRIQDYPFLQLIISDDCSLDNTVQLCQKWKDTYLSELPNVIILENAFNTGIVENFNRGVKASLGEWIKCLGGDDVLESNCISKFVEASMMNPNSRFLVCNPLKFFNSNGKSIVTPISKVVQARESLQLVHYACNLPNVAPFLFFARSLYDQIGGFDTRYPMLEDIPFVFRALYSGVTLSFVNVELVRYRICEESTSNQKGRKVRSLFLDSLLMAKKELITPFLKGKGLVINAWAHNYNANFLRRDITFIIFRRSLIFLARIEYRIFIAMLRLKLF